MSTFSVAWEKPVLIRHSMIVRAQLEDAVPEAGVSIS